MNSLSDTTQPSCIILSGGAGSRMKNNDKGVMEVCGKTLIAMLLDSISGEVDDITISANRNRDRYLDYSANVFADEDRFKLQGPLAGIASCLPACEKDLVLVCCCDMPLIPAGLVSELIQQIEQHEIAVCNLKGRQQLLFLMRASLLAGIITALERGQLSLMAWLGSCDVIDVVTPPSPPYLSNINTPEDLELLRESLSSKNK